MRILFFVHRYWPEVGGVEKYIHNLAEALLSMGHRLDVVAGATRGSLPDREVHEGVAVHRFPALRSPLRARVWFLSHLALFRRADVIHVSNTYMLEYLWRMLGPFIDARKVFLTRHGMSYRYPVPESEKQRAFVSLRLARGIVHDGAFIEKWLGVRPDLCPDQGLNPPADALEPVPEGASNTAVFIGRLEPDSGIGIYLDAVRILSNRKTLPSIRADGGGAPCSAQRSVGDGFTSRKRFADPSVPHSFRRKGWGIPVVSDAGAFRLEVYGDGSLAQSLRARVRRDALPVRFHGAVPGAQRHITDGCFAFVDGRMAIQEAMARRRLVLAAYVNPLKRDYVATETFSPYLVAVSSGAELADKVAYYAAHPEERRLRVRQAFEYARNLSWQRTAQSYLRLWQEKRG